MNTATDLEIFLWVEGDGIPSQESFPVHMSSADTVSSLKDCVFKTINIHAVDLRLWKLNNSIPLAANGVDNTVYSLLPNLADVAEQLSAGCDVLGDYFPLSAPPRQLHMIVTTPTSHRDQILTNFWHTLWHHDRTVSPGIPFFERHTIERDGSRPEIGLPAACWTLQLPQEVSERFPLLISTFLIRDDYMEAFRQLFLSVGWDVPHLPEKLDSIDEFENPLWEISETMPRSSISGFILTGHPGIGKSTWLLILLVLRLNAKLPTIYQIRPDVTLFFSANGVRTSKKSVSLLGSLIIDACPNAVWALVDSNEVLKSVHSRYYYSNIFVIQTPPPQEDRLDWTSKCRCELFFLRPWSLSELLSARKFQTTLCSESQLADFFEQYGPSAHVRLAYYQSQKPEEENRSNLRNALDSIPRDDLGRFLDPIIIHWQNRDHDVPLPLHRVFVLYPGVPRDTAYFQLSSPMVRDLLVETWKIKTGKTTMDLFKVFLGNTFTKACAGSLLEPITDG